MLAKWPPREMKYVEKLEDKWMHSEDKPDY